MDDSIQISETIEDCEPIVLKERAKSNIATLEEEFLKVAASFFGKLNGSMDAAESVMADIESILDSVCNYFTKEFELTTAQLTPENQIVYKNCMDLATNRIKHTIRKVNTEHKVKTALTKRGVFQMPEKKIFDEINVQIGLSFETVKSEVTILPMEHQIKKFLERPKILETILQYQREVSNTSVGEYNHFLNGKTWKIIKEQFVDKDVIPIFLYNDDFAPDDSLSPHGASNKISAYYYM